MKKVQDEGSRLKMDLQRNNAKRRKSKTWLTRKKIMAVDKKIQAIPDFKPIEEPNPEAEILIKDARREANSDDIDVIQTDDGGAAVDFDPPSRPMTTGFKTI